MTRNIPSYSQLLDVTDEAYKRRACGATSLAMLLGACNLEQPPTVDEVLTRGIETGAYEEGNGWLHREMAELARSYGVFAHAEDWSGDPGWAAWEHLQGFVMHGPIMLSVTKEFSPSESSHLIVLIALTETEAVINDPFREVRDDVHYTVPLEQLKQHWTKRILCVHPKTK